MGEQKTSDELILLLVLGGFREETSTWTKMRMFNREARDSKCKTCGGKWMVYLGKKVDLCIYF